MSTPRGSYTRGCCATAIAATCWALLAGGAQAAQSELSLRFASEQPGTATALHLRIVYRDPANPDGKPSPIRHLVTNAPPGTRFNLGIPRCTASDEEIMAEGPSACPAESQVGQGTLTAITGFGPPFDPYPTDVTIFNTGDGVVEIVRDHRSGAILADDRLKIRGTAMIGNPPPVPGGPPDGQTAVRTIDFTYPASTRYITTPPRCASGTWASNASFTFADGTTQHVSSTTPCRRQVDRVAPRIRVDGVPHRCVRGAFSARLRIHEENTLTAVRVRVDGRLLSTTVRRRFTVGVRAGGLEPGRHRLSVVAVDGTGNWARKRARFRRCD